MKKAIKAMIVSAVIAVAAFAGNSSFAAPASFAYQGVILEENGTVPVSKNRIIEFRIYDGPTSETILWGRAYNVLLDDNGLFNVPLSDATGSSIPDVPEKGLESVLSTHVSTTLYVGLTVDGSSGEISPRQAILSVPYAMHAIDAEKASTGFQVTGKTTVESLEATGTSSLADVQVQSLSSTSNITVSASGAFVGYGTIPVGGIIMWSGSATDIPDGWLLCDGDNNTPDLRGRFVVGYDPEDPDYSTPGLGKGEKEHTLTTDEMPSHSHTVNTGTAEFDLPLLTLEPKTMLMSGSSSGHTSTATGGGKPHENRPPFYVICFIIRVQ